MKRLIVSTLMLLVVVSTTSCRPNVKVVPRLVVILEKQDEVGNYKIVDAPGEDEALPRIFVIAPKELVGISQTSFKELAAKITILKAENEKLKARLGEH